MTPAAQSPVTFRAFAIGMLASVGIDLLMSYNDYYLHNSLMIGNHFPVLSIVLVALLVLGLNVAARKWFGADGLSAGELILIWGMMGVAGGIASAGVNRYFPSWVVAPAYYATSSNEYGPYLLNHMPDWMVVSRDPNSPAVKWFMEGLPRGAEIPWGMWVRPFLVWGLFVALLWAANFALCAFFYQQWSKGERLIFPVVQMPVELAREAPRGKLLNEFLSNPLTWIGIGIPCLIWGWNGLRSYIVGIPQIPVSWYFWSIFPDRPWSEFHPENLKIYFTVIGLTFLLTTEIAFSLWFFFLAYKLSFVFIAWLGTGATGFWGDWGTRIPVFETAGAMLAITIFLFWSARGTLKGWLARALSLRTDPERDVLPPAVSLGLIVAGLGGMAGWSLLSGAQWWASILGVLLFVMVLLVLTRVIAEAGLLFVQSNVVPYDVVVGLFPQSMLTGPTMTALMMQKAIVMNDLREILMPFAMNGMKAADMVRMNVGKVMGVFALTAMVAYGVSAYSRTATSYKYGAVNMDQWASVQSPGSFLKNVVDRQKNPPNYDRTRFADREFLPVNVAHVLCGAAITAGMLVMRAWFLWWPLHPFGLVMCGTWAMSMIWFSILIGWALKALIMTFGGAKMYRRALPLFLGLVLGESMISAFWMAVGFITQTPGLYILPN
jgi:hypothetical protein